MVGIPSGSSPSGEIRSARREAISYSQNLWFDPTRHVELSTITVFVDERDPSNYYMDLSFLPKVR